jgi:hypothetical protein
LASAELTVSVVLVSVSTLFGTLAVSVSALNWPGENKSTRHAIIKVSVIFFMLMNLICECIFTFQRSANLNPKALHNFGKELHHSHIEARWCKQENPCITEVLSRLTS